jgi:hypothetical protein
LSLTIWGRMWAVCFRTYLNRQYGTVRNGTAGRNYVMWSFINCTVHWNFMGNKIKEGMTGRIHCMLGREDLN